MSDSNERFADVQRGASHAERGFNQWTAAASALVASFVLGHTAIAQTTPHTALRSVISVPGAPTRGFSYDGSYVDTGRKLYYLGDRSTKGIDFVDMAAGKVVAQLTGILVGQVRKGDKPDNNVSGPNALEMVGENELWIGDGDSTIKIVDLNSRTLVATIPTGGAARTDFVAYDPDDRVVLATNKNDAPPFLSFVDPQSRKIVAKLEVHASSLDGVVYNPAQKRFLVSVGTTAENPQGEVAAVDPVAHTVVAHYPAPECFPAGLALGPSNHLLVGCSDDALAAGFKAKTLIMNAADGAVLATINEVGGANYVAYGAGNKRFYVGARDMTADGTKNTSTTPVLGIIDAGSMRFIENVPTAPNAKAVAVDPATNCVYVPLTTSPSGPGIGVFSD